MHRITSIWLNRCDFCYLNHWIVNVTGHAQKQVHLTWSYYPFASYTIHSVTELHTKYLSNFFAGNFEFRFSKSSVLLCAGVPYMGCVCCWTLLCTCILPVQVIFTCKRVLILEDPLATCYVYKYGVLNWIVISSKLLLFFKTQCGLIIWINLKFYQLT